MKSNKPISYTDKQLVHTLSNNGNSIREIADALGLSVGVVHKIIHESIEISQLPELLGDGCYTTSTRTGELVESTPIDYDEELTIGQPGQLTHLESGYPDIYYNEQSKRWEIWMNNKRIWRATSLTKACEVRLAKGKLRKDEIELLEAVIACGDELQEALNSPPI